MGLVVPGWRGAAVILLANRRGTLSRQARQDADDITSMSYLRENFGYVAQPGKLRVRANAGELPGRSRSEWNDQPARGGRIVK